MTDNWLTPPVMCPGFVYKIKASPKKERIFPSIFLVHVFFKSLNPALTFYRPFISGQMDKLRYTSPKKGCAVIWLKVYFALHIFK